MPYRYVPLLRSKAGEATALGHLANAAKDRLYPIVHVCENSPATFAVRMSQSWSERPVALDGLFSFNTTGSTADFVTMFDSLGQLGLPVVPSTESDAPAPYTAAVQPLVGRYAPGIVMKATLRQLGGAERRVRAQGWRPRDTDLVIALGEVANLGAAEFADYVAHTVTANVGQPARWRSITLAASAAPNHLGGLPIGRNQIPRVDWQVWQAVSQQVQFQLDFGDYVHLSPDLTDPPGVAMARAPVSVRYAIDDDWVILKGRPTSGPNGVAMGTQYRRHATALTGDPQFGGVARCWGDGRIQQISGGAVTSGSRSTWAGILLNRHMSLVADRLP